MKIKINKRVVENYFAPLIVPEIGINHNGSLELIFKMIDKLSEIGAECVKFQCFSTDEFMGPNKTKFSYISQKKNKTEIMSEMFKRYEFNKEQFNKIFSYVKKKKMTFFATATDRDYVDYLDSKSVPCYKVGSDDLTHHYLISHIAKKKKPIIISTGMSNLEEVKKTVSIIEKFNKKIIILYCVSIYPAPDEKINLLKLKELQNTFAYPVGFSDHSDGNFSSITAMSMGACLIERHFTLDKNLEGPDHRFSIDIKDLKDLISSAKKINRIFGSKSMTLNSDEKEMRKLCRRSIYIKNTKEKGEKITIDDIGFYRPGDGINSSEIFKILNKTCKVNIKKNTKFKFSMINKYSSN